MIYAQLNKNRIFLILLVVIIFMPLLVFESNSFADEKWDQLIQKMMNANNQGNYNDGLKWAQEAYEYAEMHFGARHVNTLAMLNNMAFLHKMTGNYENAESFYEKALKLSEEILGAEHPDINVPGLHL